MGSRGASYFVFVAVLVLGHFTLHLALGLGTEAPDLLTIAALLAARRLRTTPAVALGFVLGVLADAMALESFGAGALALTLVSFLGARSRDFFEGESLLFVLVYLFLGKWLHDALLFLISGLAAEGALVERLAVDMPLLALYGAAAGLVALLLYRATSGQRT